VRSKLSEIQEVHKKEAARKEKIERAKKEIGDAEEELANLPEYVPRDEILVGSTLYISSRWFCPKQCQFSIVRKVE
jgi:hypothetical protein